MFGLTAFSQSPFAALGQGVIAGAVSESLSASDAVSATLVANGSVQELLSVLDTTTNNIVMGASIAESMLVIDQYQQVSGKFVYVNESISVNALQNVSSGTYNVDVAESASVTEAEAAGKLYTKSVAESASIADAQSGTFNYIVSTDESVAATDTITYTVDTKGIVTGVLLTIGLSSPLVWEQVNDDQSPNWVEIKD